MLVYVDVIIMKLLQSVLMEPLDLLELDHHPLKEEWRSATTTSGALSVMTHGTV